MENSDGVLSGTIVTISASYDNYNAGARSLSFTLGGEDASNYYLTFAELIFMKMFPFQDILFRLGKRDGGTPNFSGHQRSGNIYYLSGYHYLRIQFYELPNLLA